jgi:hypothetical protein
MAKPRDKNYHGHSAIFRSPVCGKLSFAYKNDAKEKLRRTVRHPEYPKDTNKIISIYKCIKCGFYHLGHSYETKKPSTFVDGFHDQAKLE